MSRINLDFFQLVILFASVQGIIFGSLILLLKKYRSKSSKYIAFTIFMISLTNIHHVIVVDYSFIPLISFIRKIYIPWQSLATVGFFLFINSIYGIQKLGKRKSIIVFSPFVAIACIHLGQYAYQLWFDESYVITRYYEKGIFLYTNLAGFIHGPFLINFVEKLVIAYEASSPKSAEKITSETQWIKNLIKYGKILISLGIASVLVILVIDLKHSYAAYPFLILTSAWVYWVAIAGINKTKKLERQIDSQEDTDKINTDVKIGSGTFRSIDNFIKIRKPYLDPEMSLKTLADQFFISVGYLSQLVNVHTQKSFSDYINEFRVEESKAMLLDNNYDQFTIESIGLECGFKSKSNFYAAFKKFTGLTPNEYKKKKKVVLNDQVLEYTVH